MKKVNCGKFQNVLHECTGIRGQLTFPIEGQVADMLGFVGSLVVSAAKALRSAFVKGRVKIHHRQYVNEEAWLCANKTLFIATGPGRFNLRAIVCQFLLRTKRNHTSNKEERYFRRAAAAFYEKKQRKAPG